jgi:tRNA threonylcarbamoyladenosine biosynthesis protein TsaB
MNPPGRPKGEFRSAQHEGTPVSLIGSPSNARLLAFDTSTERMAVAVLAPSGEHLADEPGGASASAGLLPCIQALLAGAGLAQSDLQAIAFGRGPGAFTGLRTSGAVAQGLAFGLGVPVLPIDSLLIVAEDARSQLAPAGEPFEVDVLMDARMAQIYAARCAWDGSRWSTPRPAELITQLALAETWRLRPPAHVAGSALAVFGELLPVPPGVRRAPVEHGRAAALLRLALRAWRAGEAVDAALALPLYVRDKVAQTSAERQLERERPA